MSSPKTILALLAIAFVLFFLACSEDSTETETQMEAYSPGLQSFELTWEDRPRTYYVYFPSEIHAEKRLPVLYVLHGGGGNAPDLMRFTFNRFNELADIHGFIVVYPEGFENQWNDGRDVIGLATAWDEDIDDVGFISEIFRGLDGQYNIDADRVFTSGISNGGFMSSRLLCDRADLFRGGAIVTATLHENYLSQCSPSNATAVLVLNGTEDPLVPYEGGPITVLGQERGLVISTGDYMQFWADNSGCSTAPVIIDLPDNEDDGTTVQRHDYPSCNGQNPVRLYRIEGGGHTWPGGLEGLPEILVGRTTKEIVACDLIWEFFSGL